MKTKLRQRSTTRLQFATVGPSLTQQSEADACDINKIMDKYRKGQLVQHTNNMQGNYGDFSNVSDYQTSLNCVMDAEERFFGLPAHIRKEFDNNPQQLISFISNSKNYDRADELGLLSPEKSAAHRQKKQMELQKLNQTTQNQTTQNQTKSKEPQHVTQKDD